MQIHYITASESTSIFAVGAPEHDVVVWDFSKRLKLGEFKTIMDAGGKRLAVYNREPRLLVAGAYNRYGICAYNLGCPNEKVWWRRDLKNPQVITVSERLGLMASSFGYRALKLIDVATGDTIRKFPKAFECYFGPIDDEIVLAESFGAVWSASIKSGRMICNYPVPCGALHISQSEEAILISSFSPTKIIGLQTPKQVAPGTLLCYSRDARLLWRYEAAPSAHFLRTAWCPALKLWFAIEWPYVHGGVMELKAFNLEGKLVHKAIVGDVTTEFFLNGRYLITSAGEILELPHLNLLWRFGD
ncbi:MAG: hypothetical protein ACYC0V_13215 [Armatimonadota bacterium]